MSELIQISHSRVESFLSCERKDYYGYHLGLKRKKEGIALGLGNAVHSCTEALYAKLLSHGSKASVQRKHWEQGVAAMWARFHELVAEGWVDEDPKRWSLEEILTHYVENESLVQAGYAILAVEKEFHVRWSEESSILFRVDLIVRDPGGRQLVVDTKTVWDFYSETEMRLLPQLAKYAGMLRFLGHRIEGGAYNMIRSRRVAGGKKLLKAEMIAQLEAVGGLTTGTVAELEARLAARGIPVQAPPTKDQLYQLAQVPLSSERIRRALEEQFGAASRILDRMKLTAEQYDQQALRSVSRMNCKSCSFRLICEPELNGEDTRLALEMYEHRDPRELPELDGEDEE